jgi:hypothetical protein
MLWAKDCRTVDPRGARMIPNAITLAQAGRLPAAAFPISPATGRIIPAVAVAVAAVVAVVAPKTEPAAIPAPRTGSAADYFGMFRACACGHSSAWHNGAFGDAWRAGLQVRGGCESGIEDGTAGICSCARFSDPGTAT